MTELPPPTEPATPAPPTAPAAPQAVGTLGTAVAVLLVVGALLMTPAFLSVWTEYTLVADHVAGRLSEDAFWEQYDSFSSLLSMMLSFPVLIAASVSLLVWAYRARTNAALISPHRHFRYSPGFSAGGLIVPFANLWWSRPIFEDIWNASRPSDAADDRAQPVRVWWVTSVVATLVSVVGNAVIPMQVLTYSSGGGLVDGGEEALAGFLTTALFNTVLFALAVAGMVLLAVIVRRVSRWQTEALIAPPAV